MQFWHIFAKHGEVNKVLTKQNVMFLNEKDVEKEKILQQQQTFLTSLKESLMNLLKMTTSRMETM